MDTNFGTHGMIRLVQLRHPEHGRRVAVVEENQLRLLREVDSIYGLAMKWLAESGERSPSPRTKTEPTKRRSPSPRPSPSEPDWPSGEGESAATKGFEEFARRLAGAEVVAYDAVHSGKSAWRLLPAYDHPEEPARC